MLQGTRSQSDAQSEIRYRLDRLHERHPRYVQRDMVDRWSTTYYDVPFHTDSAFASANPVPSASATGGAGHAQVRRGHVRGRSLTHGRAH